MITLFAVSDPAAQEHYRVELAGQVLGHLRKHATHWTARDADDALLPDLVLTLSELRAIMEGQASIEDIYGDPDVAARRGDADEAERAEVKAAAKIKVDGRTKEAREAKARAEAGAAAAAGQDANGQPVGEADGAGMDELPSQAAEGKVAATPTEPVLEDRSAQQTAQGGSAGANADGPAGGDEKRPPAPPAKLLFGNRG